MVITCLFCDKDVTQDYKSYGDYYKPNRTNYICSRCGRVLLTRAAADDFPSSRFSEEEKSAISITFRNEWEREGKNPASKRRRKTLDDLKRIIKQFQPKDPLEKMDIALINIEKGSHYIGAQSPVNCFIDYPYYYCKELGELEAVLHLADDESLIKIYYSDDPDHLDQVEKGMLDKPPITYCVLTTKGYHRLRELQRPNQESNQCFVAMWFGAEMKDAFDNAIKPAIEYIEPGETDPRFKAVKIDNVEHLNDINDEIIAQIRRSRFMVCDLTGYRGGVYFEAGFAYGLGLDVIYTCRKDWARAETLKDTNGKQVKFLFDGKGNKIKVQKEGVHFDLTHRNRIEWDSDALDEFKSKLENRIKALIY